MRYIYCHPLFDERKCAHRFSFRLKEIFDEYGLVLERFDYSGTGEAEGEFKDVSLTTLREDIFKQTKGQEVCLIGVRFGASLAFDYSTRGIGQVRHLILLAPVINGIDYINYLYRKQRVKDFMTGNLASLQNEGYRNLEGYKTSVNLIEEIKKNSLIEMVGGCSAKATIAIVQISEVVKIDEEYKILTRRLKEAKKQVFFERVNLPMFWERLPESDYSGLTRKIVEWCRD